jgi:hypothetical protein
MATGEKVPHKRPASHLVLVLRQLEEPADQGVELMLAEVVGEALAPGVITQ